MTFNRMNAVVALALLGACTQDGGDAPVITNLALSQTGIGQSAAVPQIAIDPADPQRVAVIWRYLSMAEANRRGVPRGFECHLSLSSDGGTSFTDQKLAWGLAEAAICNSPFVQIGPNGELLIGATLTGVLPQDAPAGSHAFGQVGIRFSTDWGKSWSATQSLIASDDGDKFATNPAVPKAATEVPWDGGRGVIDLASGMITIAGGFPAPPGEALHSQRFVTSSEDDGKSWGAIYAFGAPGWSQRWDGHMISAHGILAITYLADQVPVEGAECLCLVFATSRDGGASFQRHFVTELRNFDRLVHYPPLAAHPLDQARYAIAYVGEEGGAPIIQLTPDGGESWRQAASPAAPAGVVRASRPSLAYAPDGTLVLLWRGYHDDGSYDAYMAAAVDGEHFGAPVKVSTAVSPEPSEYLTDYSVTGDFITALAVGPGVAHAAWSDWRTGETGQVVYAKVPLALLTDRGS